MYNAHMAIKSKGRTAMITLELKLKKIVLNAAVDILLKGINKSPERCVRNLIELGTNAYPDSLTKSECKDLNNHLLELCKSHDKEKVKKMFFASFYHMSEQELF